MVELVAVYGDLPDPSFVFFRSQNEKLYGNMTETTTSASSRSWYIKHNIVLQGKCGCMVEIVPTLSAAKESPRGPER